MEITPPPDLPTPEETELLDGVLGTATDPWRGGPRTGRATRVAVGLGPNRQVVRSQLLPALVALQQGVGWISRGAVGALAERLDMPPAEIWGVVTFYDLLDVEPPSLEVIHVCNDIMCPTGDDQCAELQADGFDARPSSCLGQCASPPGVMRTRPWTVVPETPHHEGHPVRLLAERHPYLALRQALTSTAPEVVSTVRESGLVGRGGAAFPVGVKWDAARRSPSEERIVICNADESEPGTFKDRLLLDLHPHLVLEGLIIAAYAVGATRGYVYVRAEYPDARSAMEAAIAEARTSGVLGPDVAGSGFPFDVEVRSGAGAYICGEETALLNSIEGRRGEPRSKPPFPTEVGLFGLPTVINNVETLANVPLIIADGIDSFRSVGTPESPGTKLFSVSGDVARPGVYELAFGTTLADLLALVGARGPRAVLVGGAAGSFVDRYDFPLSFEGARAAGATLGSGAVAVFSPETDFTRVCRRIAAFFAHESCGQCVPCRIGTVRQAEAVEALASDPTRLSVLDDIDRAMSDSSICGLGQGAASAIRSAIRLGLVGPAHA